MDAVDALWVVIDELHRFGGDGGEPDGVESLPAAELVEARLPGATRRLAAYGTLRPGHTNHHVVDGLGTWRPGAVRGHVGDWCGYPILTVDRAGPTVPVEVLEGDRVATAWPRIDAFEGSAYRRDLVVVELDDGEVVAACTYVAVDRRSSDA